MKITLIYNWNHELGWMYKDDTLLEYGNFDYLRPEPIFTVLKAVEVDFDVFVMSDDIYNDVAFVGEGPPATLPNWLDQCEKMEIT